MSVYAKAYDSAMANYNEAIAEQQLEVQKAAMRGDAEGLARARQEIAALRVQAREFDEHAREDIRAMNAPSAGMDDMSRGDVALCKQYNMQPKEFEIAKSWTSDPRVSNKERVETYLKNKERYRQMKASGEYDDTQGKVFK
jgi:hypothetical protein